jgi:KDO2-lipid IV(A) lauroyltransferase
MLELGVLWWSSERRLRRLIHVEGDVHLAQNSSRPVMWLVPHFLGMDVAGMASQLFQTRPVCAMYQQQTNPVFDQAIRRGRARFGLGELHTRHDNALRLVRAIRRGRVFFNLPDMDFGLKDSAFVPFFGRPAATLLAPARLARSLDMVVQPVLTEILPGGQGYRVSFLPAWNGLDQLDEQDSEEQAAQRMNRWIEERIRERPEQYLWVHKRFKTRAPGQPAFYN